VHLVRFYYKNISRCTLLWISNSYLSRICLSHVPSERKRNFGGYSSIGISSPSYSYSTYSSGCWESLTKIHQLKVLCLNWSWAQSTTQKLRRRLW